MIPFPTPPNVNRESLSALEDYFRGLGHPTDPFQYPDLPWHLRREAQARLTEAFGLESLRGTPMHWIRPKVTKAGRMDVRAMARFNISRATALSTEDFGMTAISQMYFQHRPERPPGEKFALSYNRLTERNLINLHEQRLNKLRDVGRYMVFDVETPTLDPKHGIRQLSARVYDPSGKELKNINLHFKSSMMDLGHYNTQDFASFMRSLAGGEIELINSGAFAGSLEDFFEEAAKVQTIVGQNAAFDIRQMQQAKAAIYNKASPQYREMIDAFFKKAESASFVDTAAHMRFLMGDLNPAPELIARNIFTPASIENIILHTSFAEDIVNLGMASQGQVLENLTRLHAGDVDTWWTNHLFQVMRRIYAEDNLDLLKPNVRPDFITDDIVHNIMRGGALTPFTHISDTELMDRRMLEYLENRNLVQRTGNLITEGTVTPLQQMMFLTRDLGMETGKVDATRVAFNAGMYQRFGQREGFLTKAGVFARQASFPDEVKWSTFQDAARRAGIPFSGLSFVERHLSSVLGRAGPGLVNKVLGDIAPITEWGGHTAAKVVRSNIANLPMGLIREMEDAGVLSSAISDVGKRVQYLSMSPFKYLHKPTGTERIDIALGLKPFSDNPTEFEKQLRDIKTFLKSKVGADTNYGLTDNLADELVEAMRATGHQAGIQIGLLGSRTPGVAEIYSTLESLGFKNVDTAVSDFVLPYMGEVEGKIRTGPVLSTVADEIYERETDVARELEALSGIHREFSKDIGQGRHMQFFLEAARRGADETGDLAYRMYNTTTKALSHLTPRNIGVAAAVGLGAVLYRSYRQRQEYDETLDVQPFEDGNFYAEYQRDLGIDPRPPQQLNVRPDFLSTAGVTTMLDEEKTRHTKMGPSKNNHLYGGVYS
ncbi:MAG TPA: hypothetical protein VJ742_12355 [Nitrososphaera sp.]|nr:hypothetical protein [Nitrososphaera sp.]